MKTGKPERLLPMKLRNRCLFAIFSLTIPVFFHSSPGIAASLTLLGGAFQRLSEPARTAEAGFSLSEQTWAASYGGGAVLGLRNDKRLSFRIGVYYMPMQYTANLTDDVLNETTPVSESYTFVRVPLGMSLKLLKAIELTGGVYYDQPVSQNLEADYGVYVGGAVTLPFYGKTKLVIQPSYQMGLRTFGDARNSDWSVLGGLSFGN